MSLERKQSYGCTELSWLHIGEELLIPPESTRFGAWRAEFGERAFWK